MTGLKKGIKPTGRKEAYMESSLNQLQILQTVLCGNVKVRICKKNTEAIITIAQDQALRTKWIKANIDGID